MNPKPFPDVLGLTVEPPRLTPDEWDMVASVMDLIETAAKIGTPPGRRDCPTARALSYDAALHSAMRTSKRWRADGGSAFRSFYWGYAIQHVRKYWKRKTSPTISLDSTFVREGEIMRPLLDVIEDESAPDVIPTEIPREVSELRGLTHKQRKVLSVYFGLHGVGPWTMREIGDRSEFSRSAAGMHLIKGLDRLRKIIRRADNGN